MNLFAGKDGFAGNKCFFRKPLESLFGGYVIAIESNRVYTEHVDTHIQVPSRTIEMAW